MNHQPLALRPKLLGALDFAERQVRHVVEAYPDFFPICTMQGKWVHAGEAWTNWCEGFLPGMMWILHGHTENAWWREQAEHYCRLIEPRKNDRTVHDLGFLFWSSWKRWCDLSGDDTIKEVVITAGKTMGLRFKEKGQYLCSFVADESLFIDIMMNVGIVFYTAQQTGDAALLHKAHQHCLTTRRYLVRGDGSTAHEGIFDPETGEFLRQSTHQGWRGDSTWTRGLTWAMYGFGTAYSMTEDTRYLETARMCADFYLNHTPFEEDAPAGPGVPPNDYDDPRRPVLYESSAAAIAASGLLDLSQLADDPTASARYRQAALVILDTLSGPRYLAIDARDWEGVLMHGVYHEPKGLGVDESMIWGDYFFLEAVDKALSLEGVLR